MMILNHHILSQVPDNASCEKCFAYIYDLGFRNYEVLSLADEDCTVQNMHAKHRVITIPISKFKFMFTQPSKTSKNKLCEPPNLLKISVLIIYTWHVPYILP